MNKQIETIKVNSSDGGEVYRLLNMVHSMAGSLANSPSKEFFLYSTNSDPAYGPITTVWSNGIVDIEARTWRDESPAYHEYEMRASRRESDDE